MRTRISNLLFGVILLALTPQTAFSQTGEHLLAFTADIKRQLGANPRMCAYKKKEELKYEDYCGVPDRNSNWWKCSIRVDKANEAIFRWNAFVEECIRSGKARNEAAAPRPVPNRSSGSSSNSGSGDVTAKPETPQHATRGQKCAAEFARCKTQCNGAKYTDICMAGCDDENGECTGETEELRRAIEQNERILRSRNSRSTAPSSTSCVAFGGGLPYYLDPSMSGHHCEGRMRGGSEGTYCSPSRFAEIAAESGANSCN